MKANKYISKREHFLLLIFAFLFFGFVALTFANNSLHSYNSSVSEQFEDSNSYPSNQHRLGLSGSMGTHQIGGLHFFTLFIFIALFKTKRFLLSTLLTIFYAIVFVYGLFIRFNGSRLSGEEFAPKVNFLNQIYFEANGFDYLAAVLISILLFWQISILLRMLIKTLQRKSELP